MGDSVSTPAEIVRGEGGPAAGEGGRAASEGGRAPRTFSPPDVAMERRADGTIILTERQPLGDYEDSLAAVLRQKAEGHPDRALAAERDANDAWVTLSYGEARQ